MAHTLVSIYYIRLNSIPESDVAFKNDILLWLAREIYHVSTTEEKGKGEGGAEIEIEIQIDG